MGGHVTEVRDCEWLAVRVRVGGGVTVSVVEGVSEGLVDSDS